MTAARCILQTILLPYVVGRACDLFQQNNARLHIARQTVDFVQEVSVNALPLRLRSLDLNSIEHM